MDRNERYRMLSTGRGGEFRNLVLNMTNDPRDLPTKSEVKARLAELYPAANDEARETMFGKLVEVARARSAGADLLELRGICDEYVLKVERELADDDRLLPSGDGEDTTAADVRGALDAIDNFNPAERDARALAESVKQDELTANRLRQMGGQ